MEVPPEGHYKLLSNTLSSTFLFNHFSFTDSIGEDPFEFQITLSDGGRVRAWKQILDRHDGSYIGRFRLYETYKGVVMELKYKGQHIADSPYKFEGKLRINCSQIIISVFYPTSTL